MDDKGRRSTLSSQTLGEVEMVGREPVGRDSSSSGCGRIDSGDCWRAGRRPRSGAPLLAADGVEAVTAGSAGAHVGGLARGVSAAPGGGGGLVGAGAVPGAPAGGVPRQLRDGEGVRAAVAGDAAARGGDADAVRDASRAAEPDRLGAGAGPSRRGVGGAARVRADARLFATGGRDRLARRRLPPLALGVRHPGNDGLRDLPRPRGSDDAVTVLGADFAGVLVRDGWAPYRRYRGGIHQSCVSHLLRRCRELQEEHPDSPWAAQVQAVLQAGLDVRDRCNDGALSEHVLASVRGRLVAGLGRLVDAPPRLDDAKRFAAHLASEFSAVFLFLRDPSLDATNWRAEQAIRPAVVARKVCGGNRTRHGADTQQVLASVVRTARQRDLDLPALIATMLRATNPIVPEVLGLPPPPA